LTLHILSAVSEDEARRISERTKAALAAAKARGTLLGSARPDHWKGRENARLQGLAKGREVARIVRSEKALEAVADLIPEMQQRRDAGESLATIAAALNDAGHKTTRGGVWTAMQVKRALDRAAAANN
jgi:DNA invertase Pin-like site-specific DNA recombinase